MDQIDAGRASAAHRRLLSRDARRDAAALRRQRLALLLGSRVADADVERILSGLGLAVTATADGWDVEAPTFRVDLQREVDLIEEVGRHYGFDKLEPTFPGRHRAGARARPAHSARSAGAPALTAAGLSEAVTFGFIEAKAADAFAMARTPIGRSRSPIRCPPSSTRSAASLITGPRRRRGPQSPARPTERRPVRDRDAFFGRRRNARPSVSPGPDRRRRSTGQVARPTSTSSTSRASSNGSAKLLAIVRRRFDRRASSLSGIADQTAAVLATGGRGSASSVSCAPAVADARELPRHDRSLRRRVGPRRIHGSAGERARGGRSLPRHPFVVRDLSIVVADTLPAEIIRGTIQTAGASTPARPGGRRLFRSLSRQGHSGRHGEPVGASDVSGAGSHADATWRGPDRASTRISPAWRGEHGAVQR